jgi:hypothetical protein
MTHGTGRVGHKKEPEMARRHTATTACRRAVLSRLGILDRLRKLGIDSLGRQLLQLFFWITHRKLFAICSAPRVGHRPRMPPAHPLPDPFGRGHTLSEPCNRAPSLSAFQHRDWRCKQRHHSCLAAATPGPRRSCDRLFLSMPFREALDVVTQPSRRLDIAHKARHTCPSTRSRKQSTNKRHRSLSDVEGFMAYYV